MRALLPLLLLLCCTPALADWAYVPPPVGAVVIYDDGRSSRIDAISGERITVVSEDHGKTERLVYRTWLVRERFLQGGKAGELMLDTGAADSILRLWPLQPGESITHSFRSEQGGKLISTGLQTLTYVGEEFLELPAGAFKAQRLERRFTLTKVDDGQQYRGLQTTWHDSATGLILRVDWESEGGEGAAGSYRAVAIALP